MCFLSLMLLLSFKVLVRNLFNHDTDDRGKSGVPVLTIQSKLNETEFRFLSSEVSLVVSLGVLGRRPCVICTRREDL